MLMDYINPSGLQSKSKFISGVIEEEGYQSRSNSDMNSEKDLLDLE